MNNMMNLLNELEGAKTIAIAGHIRPDGDCIGSCTGLYLYLKDNLDDNVIIDVYLENVPERFKEIIGTEVIKTSMKGTESYDVFISVDSGSLDRLGFVEDLYLGTMKTINIDHHISNPNYGMVNHVVPEASSTCEVLYTLFDSNKIDINIASALYLGIAHDTGVFKYSNTSKNTMNIVAELIDKGIPFSKIIDDTFYSKTFMQNHIFGRCLLKSMLILEDKCVLSYLNKEEMDFYQALPEDLEGVIDQLRLTSGVEVAIFIYELDTQEFKVSMRSNGIVDVRKIAGRHNGGGHTKAAGCTMYGTVHDVINGLTGYIECQLRGESI